ncbi:MAG: histidine kinase [Martelella sp.]|uniref:sensor histidine kinase n=1 Tax=unclassified Martelella TaxID=2629616 RepID=UPI000C4F0E7B|nr:histidine kinase [Martelella sp.]MAU22871.1 histidine kinase [Martelella sp.]|tara:strand:- start:302 stop:1405 length:1104 start_codon:yes stop_codon:yes gene_type:complete
MVSDTVDARAAEHIASENGARGRHVPILRTFWGAQCAVWSFLILFGWTARLITFGDVFAATAMTLIVDPIAFLMTGAVHVFFLSRRRRVTSIPIVIFLLCFSVVGGFLLHGIADIVRRLVLDDMPLPLSPAMMTVFYTILLIGWSLMYFWRTALLEARSERLRAAEAQAEAVRLEMERLHLQLAPHFLFNALNSVASEIHDRPDEALEMVRRIAAYLRYCLDHAAHSRCPLADEVEAMRAYLRIQELRFEERLRTTVTVDPEALNVLVPHMILQALVENAVKHGLRHQDDAIEIGVTVERLDDRSIVIEVVNSGTLQPERPGRPAIGLANTRMRLHLHYPEGYELTLKQEDDRVVARLMLRGSACRV